MRVIGEFGKRSDVNWFVFVEDFFGRCEKSKVGGKVGSSGVRWVVFLIVKVIDDSGLN